MITTLSGIPNSGKTKIYWFLASKLSDFGKVVIFSEEDKKIILSRSQDFGVSNPENIIIETIFDREIVENSIDKYKPEIVIVDIALFFGDTFFLDTLSEKTSTSIMIVRTINRDV